MKTFILALLFTLTAHAQVWTVTKQAWTDQDERDYSRFVAAVGAAKEANICHSTLECITKAPGNFLKNADDAKMNFQVDCAYLPYVLRAYFAMKRGLPFSWIQKIQPALDPNGQPVAVTDLRYSTWGNVPVARRDFIKGSVNFNRMLLTIRDEVNSGAYRMDPRYDSPTLPSDMYSVDIKKANDQDFRGIRPGTNIYDPAGHVAVVYKIGKSGRIFYIDAHPDDSMTRGSYGMKFVRARPSSGAGFKNFRPLQVVAGRAQLAGNAQISDFSLTQFFGTNNSQQRWQAAEFSLSGQNLQYYDFVRGVMADGNLSVDPINEVYEMMDGLCMDVKDRNLAIKEALKHAIDQKPTPATLPLNIYGTSGEWEAYASPSRDARLKASFEELHDGLRKWLTPGALITYSGANLQRDLQDEYNKMVGSCKLAYTNSANQTVRFTLNDVVDHIYAMSFSPYDCVELRWGGIGGIPATCTQDATKMRWYRAEQPLRNQIERTYDVPMADTIDQLEQSTLGVRTPLNLDPRL